MLQYSVVKDKIENKIIDYSKKKDGQDAYFYSTMSSQLQKQLDNLNAKKEDHSLQDIIIAWQTYRECEQKRMLKFYADNKFTLLGTAALIVTIGVNVFYSINKHR